MESTDHSVLVIDMYSDGLPAWFSSYWQRAVEISHCSRRFMHVPLNIYQVLSYDFDSVIKSTHI